MAGKDESKTQKRERLVVFACGFGVAVFLILVIAWLGIELLVALALAYPLEIALWFLAVLSWFFILGLIALFFIRIRMLDRKGAEFNEIL